MSAASRLTGSWPLGCAAGALYALNPTAWRYCNELLTEIPLAFLLTLLAGMMLRAWTDRRRRWLAWSGALAGLTLLVKPNLVLLPVLAAAALAWPRPGLPWRTLLRRAVIVLALAGLVILPWAARNRAVFGRWFLSHAFETNLARVSAVATLVRAQGETVAPWSPRWEEIYSGLLLEARARYGSGFDPVPASAATADRTQQQLASVAGRIIRAHPVDFVLSHLGGFLRSWVPQEHRFWYEVISGRSWDSLGSAEGVLGQALRAARSEGWGAAFSLVWQARVAALPPLASALWAGWLLAYAVSAGLIARGIWQLRSRPAGLFFCLAVILYTTFLPGPISYVRFRVPVAPLLVLLTAAGLRLPAKKLFLPRR